MMVKRFVLNVYRKWGNKMKRLELLQKEFEQIENLKLLSFELMYKVREYYLVEIEAIVNYGAENKEIDV